MKRIFAVIISALICLSMLIPVSAASKHIVDLTNTLGTTGVEELEAKAVKLEKTYNCEVLFVLTSGIGNFSDTNEYAEDYYSKNAQGEGIILVHDVLNKKYTVIATENSIFTSYDKEKIGNDYNSADTFIKGVEAYLTDAEQLLYTSSIERKSELIADNANVLTEIEEQSLLAKLKKYTETLKCDIAIVTVMNTNGKTAQEYADDYYDENGYGYGKDKSGVLFLYSKSDNKWATSTYGTGMLLTTDAVDEIVSGIGDYIRNGDYNSALTKYANDIFTELSSYITDEYSDLNSVYEDTISDPSIVYPENKHNPIIWFVITFAIAFVIALIAMNVATANLKSVYSQKNANSYIVPNSFVLTNKSDTFLYSNITRTVIPKNTSSGSGSSGGTGGISNGAHVSSSGRTHGGSSGSF